VHHFNENGAHLFFKCKVVVELARDESRKGAVAVQAVCQGMFWGSHVCEELKLKCCYDVWMCRLEHNRIREGE